MPKFVWQSIRPKDYEVDGPSITLKTRTQNMHTCFSLCVFANMFTFALVCQEAVRALGVAFKLT